MIQYFSQPWAYFFRSAGQTRVDEICVRPKLYYLTQTHTHTQHSDTVACVLVSWGDDNFASLASRGAHLQRDQRYTRRASRHFRSSNNNRVEEEKNTHTVCASSNTADRRGTPQGKNVKLVARFGRDRWRWALATPRQATTAGLGLSVRSGARVCARSLSPRSLLVVILGTKYGALVRVMWYSFEFEVVFYYRYVFQC